MKRVFKCLFWLSIPTFMVGYFLQTILLPIQDFDLLSKEEIKKIQLEASLNYPVGISMFYGGLIIFFITSVYLSYCFIKKNSFFVLKVFF